MLRDPISRAHSHYQHEVARGFEDLSFEEALEQEDARLAGEEERMLEDHSYYSFEHQHHSYMARGMYLRQIERWRSVFAEDQLLIVDSSSFFSNPDAEYRSVLRFLELPERSLPSYEKMNAHSYDRMSPRGPCDLAGTLRGAEPSPRGAPRSHVRLGSVTGRMSEARTRRAAPLGGQPTEAALSDLATVARGGALNLVGVVSNTVFNFGLVIVVTRGLGITTTGIFFLAIALFNILATAAQWGADIGVIRAIPRYRVQGRSRDLRHSIRAALAPTVLAGAVLGGLMFVLAGPLGRMLTSGVHAGDLTSALRVMAPFLPVSAAYAVVLAVTRGFGTMVPTAIIDKLGRAATQLIFVLAVAIAGLPSAAVSLAWALPFALGLAAALMWMGRLLRDPSMNAEPGMAERETGGGRAVFVEFWRFTAPRGLASMFAVSILWLNTLLIGALGSAGEAGMFAAATRYLAFGQFIGVAIIQVVGPKLSEVLASDDLKRARFVYSTATWWLMALAWPLYLTMIVQAHSLLSLFGPGYQEAAATLMILGAAMLVATLVGPVDIVLLMAGKSSWNLLNTIVAIVVNVTLNLVLDPPLRDDRRRRWHGRRASC